MFRRSKKIPTWTAKTMMATTKAPRNDLRLIPAKPCALPALPSGSSDGVLPGDCVVDEDERMLAVADLVADDTSDVVPDARLEAAVVDIVELAEES